jgi:hypothetical protein
VLYFQWQRHTSINNQTAPIIKACWPVAIGSSLLVVAQLVSFQQPMAEAGEPPAGQKVQQAGSAEAVAQPVSFQQPMVEAGEPPAGQKVQQAGSAEAEQDVIAVLSNEESIAAEWAELSPRVAAEISERIHGVNQKTTSLKKMRRMLSEHLGLGKKGLELHIEAVSVLIASAVQEVTAAGQPKVFTPAERMASIVQDLGDELTEAKQCVYLATVSRVLPETLATPGVELRDITTMSREEVADCFMKAFNSPVYEQGQGGRRRQSEEPMVSKIVVFKEEHEDGDFHFHIVIVLKGARSWKPAKRTLRIRDQVACHFSCSHTQAWSAIRYGHIPTINKPKLSLTAGRMRVAQAASICLLCHSAHSMPRCGRPVQRRPRRNACLSPSHGQLSSASWT